MSLKNRDEHNRWRNKTVAFRVSPEEDKQIETYVRLSGLTKQDYIARIPTEVIGVTVVALCTSLPELVTAITALARGLEPCR